MPIPKYRVFYEKTLVFIIELSGQFSSIPLPLPFPNYSSPVLRFLRVSFFFLPHTRFRIFSELSTPRRREFLNSPTLRYH